MRVFVVGLGSIGLRHLEILERLECEVAGGRLDEAERFAPGAVVAASPTAHHLEALEWAVAHGAHAYVEKPIAAATGGVRAALDGAEGAGLIVATGYNLRFHPALETIRSAVADGRIGTLLSVRAEVGHYLPKWQPGRDYAASYAARSELGGGALLTLSHELDFVRWIAGEVESSTGVAARVSDLDLDVDDVADVLLRHENGAVSSVHMDMLDRTYNRRSRWVGADGTITWEWKGDVVCGDETLWHGDGFDLGETYEAALRDFLSAAAAGTAPRATGLDGLRVLEICETVTRAR